MFRRLILFFPLSLSAQLTVSCIDNTAIVSGITQCNGSCFVRVEPNPDNKQEPHKFPAPGFIQAEDQIGPITSNTVTFIAMRPGPWLAYYFQNVPYLQFKSVNFTCTTSPVNPPTVLICPRYKSYLGILDLQPNGTWRIHSDPLMALDTNWNVALLIVINGLIVNSNDFQYTFDSSFSDNIDGKPIIITPMKQWDSTSRIEVRWNR